MEQSIATIEQEYLSTISTANSLAQLDEIYLQLFGKNGQITLLPKSFPNLKTEQLKTVGPLFNRLKQKLEQAIQSKRQLLREKQYQELEKESLDLKQQAVIKARTGHLHPLTIFENQIVEIFQRLGFQQFEAPLIDTDYNNFQALNIPPQHPARDLWDTLYIDKHNIYSVSDTLLLRTHTSNSQIHIMQKFKPPIRLMNIGRCFRYENLDARHEHTFDQFELIYIDKGVNMSNLQYLSEYFLKSVFGQGLKVRLKPKYYPFVEPGAGVDGLCIFCKGKGCQICGQVGWLELAGAGMVHPQVLKNGGIDPQIFAGIAWGFGPARMVMLKNNISDVRVLNSADLRLL